MKIKLLSFIIAAAFAASALCYAPQVPTDLLEAYGWSDVFTSEPDGTDNAYCENNMEMEFARAVNLPGPRPSAYPNYQVIWEELKASGSSRYPYRLYLVYRYDQGELLSAFLYCNCYVFIKCYPLSATRGEIDSEVISAFDKVAFVPASSRVDYEVWNGITVREEPIRRKLRLLFSPEWVDGSTVFYESYGNDNLQRISYEASRDIVEAIGKTVRSTLSKDYQELLARPAPQFHYARGAYFAERMFRQGEDYYVVDLCASRTSAWSNDDQADQYFKWIVARPCAYPEEVFIYPAYTGQNRVHRDMREFFESKSGGAAQPEPESAGA